jgi:hypothetical protein
MVFDFWAMRCLATAGIPDATTRRSSRTVRRLLQKRRSEETSVSSRLHRINISASTPRRNKHPRKLDCVEKKLPEL